MLWIKGESEKCEIYANPESVNGSKDQPGFSLTLTIPDGPADFLVFAILGVKKKKI